MTKIISTEEELIEEFGKPASDFDYVAQSQCPTKPLFVKRVMPTMMVGDDVVGVSPMKPPSEEMLKPRQTMAESEGTKDKK